MSAASQLVEADQELVNDYYTAQGGLRSGSLERITVHDCSDTWQLHDRLVKEIRRGTCRRYDAVRSTLGDLSYEHRTVLDTVYIPFGTGFERRDSFECLRCSHRYVAATSGCKACGAKRDQSLRSLGEGADLLALALTTRWGHGSYVRMALRMPRVREAYAKAYPSNGRAPSIGDLLSFLAHEVVRGHERESFFGRLRNDCSIPHTKALEAYDVLRTARKEREAIEGRDRARLKAARNEARFEEWLGAKKTRAREKFDRMLRGSNGS